jgi:trimethylamine--corrinoid protein Co-methyltransferase
LEWFKKEQYIPSDLIDRQELKTWKATGSKDTAQRAKERVQKILKEHKPEPLKPETEKDLDNAMKDIMKQQKITSLPAVPH